MVVYELAMVVYELVNTIFSQIILIENRKELS
jgi:hypothetical protein